MQMEAFLWLFLPVFVAGGSALLSYYIMQARMDVAIAKEREILAEARAMLSSHKVTLEERVKATEEACKRQAMDDFMHDIRVEERSYVRETKSLNASRKTMVMQERIFFRNIPLSNWIEREMLVEDGQNLDQLPTAPVFTTASLPTPLATSRSTPLPATAETPLAIARLLHEVNKAHAESLEDARSDIRPALPADVQEETRPTVLLTHHATAFGAQ
jgi:hypothetical protein